MIVRVVVIVLLPKYHHHHISKNKSLEKLLAVDTLFVCDTPCVSEENTNDKDITFYRNFSLQGESVKSFSMDIFDIFSCNQRPWQQVWHAHAAAWAGCHENIVIIILRGCCKFDSFSPTLVLCFYTQDDLR